ncbi:uncharacterized protein UV8b_04029 [Ustilaginoidea virens]|uniref:Uncharacterized protein n=1 Tax=Ustilaginoidea virens TaxID=1159556 RepID=A0A8E5MGR3_USTVR|nr:uncharacterized protein UV8b_04029 [Ustilaginoidea virens]QUC19788.1 hypothetical protein UV8b_04029 [Ustilaginoidea virens]
MARHLSGDSVSLYTAICKPGRHGAGTVRFRRGSYCCCKMERSIRVQPRHLRRISAMASVYVFRWNASSPHYKPPGDGHAKPPERVLTARSNGSYSPAQAVGLASK